MINREIYQRDPGRLTLLNNGVATMTDALTEDERRTLRFELEHFVCEGQYRAGLVRILESYLNHQGQPEQAAAWISGFFGSGKSHLAKMLQFLWTDYTFPEDGASARGLARLPDDVGDRLKEISTLGRRGHGLCAAAGTLGAGAGDSVRLGLLAIVFRAAGLPESYPQARFCLWLRRNGQYDGVRGQVEANDRSFQRELNDLYVSPLIARAVLSADPTFAAGEKEAKAAIRAQFPRERDITTDAFVAAMQDALAPHSDMPCTVLILDEVQQYIGQDPKRSYVVQEVVEACSKRFGDRLLFVGTGQTALYGSTAALQRLQGRFAVNVELSDNDVETVTRRVVLAKRPDRMADIRNVLEANAGEVDRHLVGSKIGFRSEDRQTLVEDYPLLPARRRFWEHVLRAVDRAGTAGQLRTQLRIVYDAIAKTADQPLGTIVPADFLFEEISANLLQSGVLLRELHETIVQQQEDADDGTLKSRVCALVFLIGKLPRKAGADIGVRATADMLADLMVADLNVDGTALRGRLPTLLDALADAGVLMKLGDEYRLQTRESGEWDAEFRTRQHRLLNDPVAMSGKRTQRIGDAVGKALGRTRLLHGACREPRRLALHHGSESPPATGEDILVWIRDGWGATEGAVVEDARAAGQDDSTLHVFVPRVSADALARLIAARDAATATLDYKGEPKTREGVEARSGMETRRDEADNRLRALVSEIVNAARVFQGGGNEPLEGSLPDRVAEAANASLARLFPEFGVADDHRWSKVIERARSGAEHPLEAIEHEGKTDDHPVCAAVLAALGAGKKGREVRAHFSAPPYGWPRDAIDGALIALFATGHLRATVNGSAVKPRGLDQAKIQSADFRIESALIDARARLTLRKLFQTLGVDCKPNEESQAAVRMLATLRQLAASAGGEPPLPPHPDGEHLTELEALAGNEQLRSVLDHHGQLAANYRDWTRQGELASKRMPAFQRLQRLAQHAVGLDAANELQPQIDAIVANRQLLDSTDPVPPIAARLTDALRTMLAQAERTSRETYGAELQRLEDCESWRQIEPEKQQHILSELRLDTQGSAGPVGTDSDLLDSLERVSLEDWRTRTAALPQLFANARMAADRLLEPEVQHIRLSSPALRTQEDVRAWVKATERDLLDRLREGPVLVQ